jgi:dephospho-CoA kinase
LIIGLTGPAQSGKSTVAQYIVDNYGFKELSMSEDVLDAELKKRGQEITKMNRSKLGDELRKKEGMDALAKRLLEQIDSPRVVISNFRSPEEVEFFQNKTPNFHLIFINAEAEKRFERRSKIDPDSMKEFLARDERDVENKGMDKVFEMAGYSIDNNGDLKKLYEQVDAIIKKIGLPEDKQESEVE